nr:hypothetical protein BaRGS_035249 [Batillaria attramentaria]
MGVQFIDNRPIFTAPSGAPRKALYRSGDRIHPSMQGTISLALHIKRGGLLHPSHHFTGVVSDHHSSSRRPAQNTEGKGLYSRVVARQQREASPATPRREPLLTSTDTPHVSM